MPNVKNTNLSFDEINNSIAYDPDAGTFTWKVSPAKNVKAGDPAGYAKRIRNDAKTGIPIKYTYIRLKNYEIQAARVAWLLTNKEWPEGNILFADKNPLNLRLENLRTAKFKRINSNPDAQTKQSKQPYEAGRHYGLMARYGLTLDEYNAKLEAQSGLCAICKGPEVSVIHGKIKPLSVDHNHETGAVRDLLCSHCNHMIGHASERIEVLRNAISYLEKHAISANDGTKESS